VVGFIATIGMALAGTGVWALVIGGACGLAATGLAAWLYVGDWPRPGFDRGGVSSLLQFSWPLWSSRAMIVATDQGAVLTLALLLAIRDVGQFRSAEQLLYTCVWLDIILGQAIFPGLCRVKDSMSQTRDVFEKASRVAMLWAAGGGVAAILFADDLVRFVLTDKWLGAELFIRAQAIGVIVSTIGYSWDTLYKARGTTMPVLRWSAIFCASFFLLFPLLTIWRGREGAALSVILLALVGMAVRKYYVHRIGAGISFTEIARRPLAAAFLASLPILAMKGFAASSDLYAFLGAVGLFVLIYVGAVLWLERELLRNGLTLIRQGAPEGGR
jgi:PST family polysaccharide transporter